MFQVHLYAGLAAGGLLAVVGLSGALLVYAPELETGTSPAFGRVVNAQLPEQTAERLLAARPGMTLRDIRFDRHGNAIWYHLQEPDGGGQKRRDLHVLVDPATGAVMREADRSAGAWRWLRGLHHDLLSGKVGRRVNGIGAAILLLLAMTGLVVWWPGKALWRKRLGVQRGTGWKRLNWDLHSAGGFWTCAGLTFFAITGMIFAWPETARRLAGVQKEAPKRHCEVELPQGAAMAPVARLAAAAESAVAGGRISQIKFPGQRGAAVEARVKTPLDGHMHGHSRVWLHPETATVLQVEDFRNLPAAQRALAVAQQIHKGHFTDAGWPGALLRVLWILVGLAPGLLFLTGFLMWWNRVAVKRLRAAKRAGEALPRAHRAAAAAVLAVVFSAAVVAQPAVLKGRVMDGSGAAVARVKVTLQTSPPRSTETDENGVFRFERVAPGLYMVTLEAAGFASVAAQVQAGGTAEFRLEPAPLVTRVEVNAGTFDQIRLDEPVFQTGLTRDDIATRNNRRLSDVVARMPGVFMSGPPGGDKDVRLRGLDKEFSRTQVDGVMIPDGGEKRELQLNRLPSSAVQMVRIIRNPTAEFESDGLAGRLDVETRPIPQQWLMDGRLGYGARRNTLSNDVTQGQIHAGGRFGRRYGISGTFDWLDDVLPIERAVLYPNGNVESDTERQPQRSPNFFGNFGLYSERFGDFHVKPVLLRFANTKERLRQVRSAAGLLTTQEAESESKVQQTLGMTMNHRYARGSGLIVDTQAGWFGSGEDKDRQRLGYRVTNGVATADKRTLEPEFKTDKTWLFSTAVSLPVRARVWQEWKFGTSLRRRGRVKDRDRFDVMPNGQVRFTGEAKDRYRLHEDYTAGFVQNRIRLTERLSWTLGVRYERVRVDTWSTPGWAAPRVFTDLNPSSHLLYRATGNLTVRAAVSRVLARPKFDEMAPFENVSATKFVLGNPDLQPSRAWSYDAGFDYATRWATLSVNGFHKDIRGVIQEVGTGEWRQGREVFQVRNAGNGWTRGLEFEQRLRLKPFAPRWARPFSFWANQTVLESELRDGVGRAQPFKEQPRWIANLGGDFSDEKWGMSLSVMANFVSRRYDYKANGDVSSFGGSTSFDVALYQRLTGRLRLFVEGNNLSNRDRVRDEILAAGGAQWRREAFGRTLLGGLQVSF
ncbi:MAG: TonB-dependent receptor domain-containing protein [Bryobacteraceae bacterium]